VGWEIRRVTTNVLNAGFWRWHRTVLSARQVGCPVNIPSVLNWDMGGTLRRLARAGHSGFFSVISRNAWELTRSALLIRIVIIPMNRHVGSYGFLAKQQRAVGQTKESERK
jgi:hypothetical protein